MACWRPAVLADDDAIVSMSLSLYREDPTPEPVSAAQVRRTLTAFRESDVRGRVVVLDAVGRAVGYALLVAFWSNELGGEICTVDELYVEPAWRGRGHATALLTALPGASDLWPRRPVALELEITPANARARRLYGRLGFATKKNTTMRLRVRG